MQPFHCTFNAILESAGCYAYIEKVGVFFVSPSPSGIPAQGALCECVREPGLCIRGNALECAGPDPYDADDDDWAWLDCGLASDGQCQQAGSEYCEVVCPYRGRKS